MTQYRIKFRYGRFHLMRPCIIGTGEDRSDEFRSGWESVADSAFVWPLRVVRVICDLNARWYHRADGYDKWLTP